MARITSLDVGLGELILILVVAPISIGPWNLRRAWREIASCRPMRVTVLLLLAALALSAFLPRQFVVLHSTLPSLMLIVAALRAALGLVGPRHEPPRQILARARVAVESFVKCTVVGALLAPALVDLLTAYLPPILLRVASTTDLYVAYLQVGLVVGLALALPVCLYQAIYIVSPGVAAEERLLRLQRLVLVALLLGTLSGYFVALPFALTFMLGFGLEIAVPQTRVASCTHFAAMVIMWTAASFELPVVMLILAKLGLVTKRRWATFRRYAVPICFVAAAVVTPTTHPLSQTVVAIPMVVLCEVCVLAARLATRAPAAAVAA